MITFWNDHLVSPVLCKVIYDSVPIECHVPVIFIPNTKDFQVSGRCYFDRIEIYLQGIFYYGYPGEFKLWKKLLHTTYHEFGHIATYPLISHLDDAYQLDSQATRYVEGLADDWADKSLLRLAEWNKRIFQPKKLGLYFDGRIVKMKKEFHEAHGYPVLGWAIDEYRKYKCLGQISALEVAILANEYRYSYGSKWGPDSRLINRLAVDLAYTYTDHRGYKHLFFAWGDIPQILRHVAIYRTIHGKKPSELEYLEIMKRIATTLSDSHDFTIPESQDFFIPDPPEDE